MILELGELAIGVGDRMDSITDVPLLLASLLLSMNQAMNLHYPTSKENSKRC